MILGTRYEQGKLIEWWDTGDRKHHDLSSGVDVPRPFTVAENGMADGLVAASVALDDDHTLRRQLEAGIAAITAARDVAVADSTAAASARTAANTLKGQADAFAAKGAYALADLVTVGQAISQLAQAVADLEQWRATLNGNAILTDNALIGLGTIAGGT